jgi:hypothetical protein
MANGECLAFEPKFRAKKRGGRVLRRDRRTLRFFDLHCFVLGYAWGYTIGGGIWEIGGHSASSGEPGLDSRIRLWEW